MAEHIGIVACSSEGAALCYRTICTEASAGMGEHFHPEVSMHTHSLGEYMIPIRKDDWRSVGEIILSSARKLADVGAAFLICPDNTIHQAINLIRDQSPLPWLHIAEEVAAEAGRLGYRRLGILGTKSLMEGPVYPEKLQARGIESRTPSKEDRLIIDETIFAELVNGRFTAASRAVFQRMIAGLTAQGCDGVVLGCTEIPLLISPEDSSLPTLDSTRLLARAAIREALR